MPKRHWIAGLIILTLLIVIMIVVIVLSINKPPEIKYSDYRGNYGDYNPLELVMNAGETYTVTASHFQELDLNFDKIEFIDNSENNPRIFNPNAVSMSGNVITAQSNGFVNVYAYVYEKDERVKIGSEQVKIQRAWKVLVAQIQVINISEMVEITTAQQLQDISLDIAGNYILKADIDLEGFDWKSIVGHHYRDDGSYDWGESRFKGSLINPDGFVIKNLTGTSGLFGSTYGAYIDGIILENVDINSIGLYPDDAGIEYNTAVGGIVDYATNTVINNCTVDGTIKARNRTGGIVGKVDYGIIRHCEFNGTVVAEYNEGTTNYLAEAGGIAGTARIYLYGNQSFGDEDFLYMLSRYVYLTVGIFDCNVNAEITAIDYAGGIVGYNYGDSLPKDCVFMGTTLGEKGQGEICGHSRY